MGAFEVGKPAPYYCRACQAVPQAGYCNMAGCPTAPSPNDLLRRGHVTSLLILAAAINGDMALEGGENARIREGMEAALTRARHAVAALEPETSVAALQEQRDELLAALKAILATENGFYRVAMPSDLREAAREAIANAEGQ